jgi:hypothetical protein
MKNIFDYDAQANESLLGGAAATTAVGLPKPEAIQGTFAPGGSNATADALLAQMKTRTQTALAGLNAQQTAREPVVGYNPATNDVYSGGRTFKLDLNEGRANAALLDADNTQLPEGFMPITGSQVKQKLQRDFESQGMLSDLSRRTGQFVASAGSAARDVGLPGAQAVEQYGADVAARNPSQIQTAGDILSKPGTAIGEAVGEVGFDVAKAVATTAAGAAFGTKIGTALAPLTGGASIPLGAILGGAAGAFLSQLFETYGSIRREQREQGIEDKTRAAGAAIGSAALETAMGPEAAIAKLATRKVGAAAAFDLLDKGAAKAVGMGALRGAAVEGPLTEVPQSAIERFGAYKDMTSDEALNEYLIGAFKGAVGGGAMSTVTSYAEYAQAGNFLNNFNADQQTAADLTAPSPVRLAAARRVQDVLKGSSDDPRFDQQLQEFKQKLQFLESAIVSNATKEALETGATLNLFDTGATRGAVPATEQPLPEPAGRALDEFDPYAAVESRAAADRPMSEADATQRLSSTLAAQRAGEQFTTLMQQQEEAAGRIGQVGEQYQRMVGQRGDQILRAQEVGEQAQPIVAGLEQDIAAQEAPVIAAMQAGAGTQQLPGMVAGAGTVADFRRIMNPDIMQPVDTQEIQPTARTALLPAQPAPFSNIRMDRPGPAPTPAPSSLLTSRPATATTEIPTPVARGVSEGGAPKAAPSPAAPVAAGVSLADTGREDAIIEELGLTPLKGKNPLAAEIEGAAGKVPGRPSMTKQAYTAIRNAILKPGGKVDEKTASIADAMRGFAVAYKAYLNAYGNVKRFSDPLKGKDAAAAAMTRADAVVSTAELRAAEAREALRVLGEAVGGNAKDVEVLIRLVKDAVQALPKGEARNIAKSFDAMLSQAWNAAKSDTFIEDIDMFYTRPGETRSAKEAKPGTVQPLVKAAKEGYSNPRGTGSAENTYKGFLGVLQYIRFNGTGYEQLLARQIREALKASGDLPKVQFITTGTPRFDPKTNTIYINSAQSNSVVLHEALHAALQWFVYNNPNDPIVVDLKKSVKAVISYKGELGSKAKAVQQLLVGLVKGGNELDAVLELISYGNTLNEFRKALDAMPKKGTPKSFYDAVQDVWTAAIALVRRLTGAKDNTEAMNVINRTWELLAKAAESAQPAKRARQGNVLEAAVMEDMDPLPDQAHSMQRPGGSLPSQQDIRHYNERAMPSFLSTKWIFDAIGWDKAASLGTKAVNGIADMIRADFPKAERWISYINSRFGVPQDLRGVYTQYKDDRQAGYKLSERLATYVQFQPAENVTALFAYLDGDKRALADDPATRELADEVKNWRDFYVQELSKDKKNSKIAEFFARGKFSETMLFAARPEQIASSTFGARKLNNLLGQKTQFEPDLYTGWMNLTAEGDVVLDNQRFYSVYTRQDGKNVHQGFIAESKFKAGGAPAGFYVDPTFIWFHQSKSKQGHKFVAQMTAAQAIQENRADDLANALRNTMATLAGNYASVEFAAGIEAFGKNEDGSRSEQSVVFDSIKQIEDVYNKGVTAEKDKMRINPASVLEASADIAKSGRAQNLYRTSHLWVKVPKSETYGAMAGKIIRASAWSAMNDMSDRRPVVNVQAVNGAMRWFKKSKTVYNIGTHVTNVATNFTLAMLHDIPVRTVAHATKLYAMYAANPNAMSVQDRQLMLAFMSSNASQGDFSSTEVKKALYDAMEKSITGDTESLTARLAAFAKFDKAKAEAAVKYAQGKVERADQFATEVYAAEDNVFRLAAFLKFAADKASQNSTGTASKADLQAAGDFAREAFLDYDIDSKAVRIGRQTVLPFISWTYAIIPVLGRIAVHQPWKIANLLLAYTILEHVMQEVAGGDEEDEKLRKTAPEQYRERAFEFGPYMHIRIPFLGSDKQPVYYKLGDYIPLAGLFRAQPNGFMGIERFPSVITPTGPFVSSIASIILGVDSYTGKPLSPPTDTQWEKFTDRSKAVTGQFLPQVGVDLLKWDRVADIAKGRQDKAENFEAMQMARWAGLKLYEFDVAESQAQQSRAAKAIMTEYQKEIRKVARAEARYERPDWESFNKRQTELLARMQTEVAKAKGEE